MHSLFRCFFIGWFLLRFDCLLVVDIFVDDLGHTDLASSRLLSYSTSNLFTLDHFDTVVTAIRQLVFGGLLSILLLDK